MPSAEHLWQRSGEFDVVVLATPNDVHVPHARRAVDLGKAVVVDKPLAPTTAEAADLVAHPRPPEHRSASSRTAGGTATP